MPSISHLVTDSDSWADEDVSAKAVHRTATNAELARLHHREEVADLPRKSEGLIGHPVKVIRRIGVQPLIASRRGAVDNSLSPDRRFSWIEVLKSGVTMAGMTGW